MASFVSPVNRTLVAGQGLTVAFDPAVLSSWPTAFLPANLPPGPPKAVQVQLTARRPLTASHSTRLQLIDAATGTTEIPGTWSGPSGSLDHLAAVDYWQLDNWDTSTGVYGWSNPYSTGSTATHLNIGSASDQWYGTSDFDVTFRIERANTYNESVNTLSAGVVQSVNGQQGIIVLGYADVGADPAGAAAAAQAYAVQRANQTGTQAISTVSGLTTALDGKAAAANALGYVNHGSTASTARPSGYAAIVWVGTVEPSNAVNGDLWEKTS